MDSPFRGGVARTNNNANKNCTPAFMKTRTASRITAMQARGMDTMSPGSSDSSPAWATMSGFLPNKNVTSARLTSVHIGSSRLDSSVSYPEYLPSPTSRINKTRSFNDSNLLSARGQRSLTVSPDAGLVQVNWISSGSMRDPNQSQQPCYSPIQKNHINSTKRELEMFGNRPISPQRARGPMSEYTPISRLSADGSFGNSTTERVYKDWSKDTRGRNRSTGEVDGGAVASSGPRGRVPSVGINSGRIDAIVGCY